MQPESQLVCICAILIAFLLSIPICIIQRLSMRQLSVMLTRLLNVRAWIEAVPLQHGTALSWTARDIDALIA